MQIRLMGHVLNPGSPACITDIYLPFVPSYGDNIMLSDGSLFLCGYKVVEMTGEGGSLGIIKLWPRREKL